MLPSLWAKAPARPGASLRLRGGRAHRATHAKNCGRPGPSCSGLFHDDACARDDVRNDVCVETDRFPVPGYAPGFDGLWNIIMLLSHGCFSC